MQIDNIHDAIVLIENHLTEPLVLQEVASHARMSFRHFQRQFKAMTGDSVKEYLRARRLSSAATDLATSQKRILEIALDYQFESQEAFTRAFSQRFFQTPGKFRNSSFRNIQLNKIPLTYEALEHFQRGLTLSPTITTLPSMKVVGLRATLQSFGSRTDLSNLQKVDRVYREFDIRKFEIQKVILPQGMPWDYSINAVWYSPKQPSDEMMYLVCLQVEDFHKIPQGMETLILPQARYAYFRHHGHLDHNLYTTNYAITSWFPKSVYRLGNAPILMYHYHFASGTNDIYSEHYYPVQ